eukprot:Em1027g2a
MLRKPSGYDTESLPTKSTSLSCISPTVGFPPSVIGNSHNPASVLVVPQAEEDQECELLIMDDKAYNSGGLSAPKSENERAGTSSKAFQLETQKMMQPATEHFGDKRTAGRSASGQVSAPLDRKVEPKSMNPLQLHRWSAQPLAIDSPTSDYGSGTFVSLEQTGESLKEPATESQTNVESAVPTVGENVEVISVEESEKELMRPEGGIKRAAKAQLSRDKIPRVGDFIVMQAKLTGVLYPLCDRGLSPSMYVATHLPYHYDPLRPQPPTLRFLTAEDQKRGDLPPHPPPSLPRPGHAHGDACSRTLPNCPRVIDATGPSKDSEQEPSEGYHSMELSKGEKPGPHSALLRVSEHIWLSFQMKMETHPLHLAVITKQPLMVQLLVTAGASVNFPDRRGCTSVHLAAQRRDLRILQIISRATNPLPDFTPRTLQARIERSV